MADNSVTLVPRSTPRLHSALGKNMKNIIPYIVAPIAPFLIVLFFDPSIATNVIAIKMYLAFAYAFTVPSLIVLRILKRAFGSMTGLRFILYGTLLGGLEGSVMGIISGPSSFRDFGEGIFAFGLFGLAAAALFVGATNLLNPGGPTNRRRQSREAAASRSA